MTDMIIVLDVDGGSRELFRIVSNQPVSDGSGFVFDVEHWAGCNDGERARVRLDLGQTLSLLSAFVAPD